MERYQQFCTIRADHEHVVDVVLDRREVHEEVQVLEMDTSCVILVFPFELSSTDIVSNESLDRGNAHRAACRAFL